MWQTTALFWSRNHCGLCNCYLSHAAQNCHTGNALVGSLLLCQPNFRRALLVLKKFLNEIIKPVRCLTPGTQAHKNLLEFKFFFFFFLFQCNCLIGNDVSSNMKSLLKDFLQDVASLSFKPTRFKKSSYFLKTCCICFLCIQYEYEWV